MSLFRLTILAALAAAGTAQAQVNAISLTPTRVVGPGLYVIDLAAERAWYESKLGMTVLKTYPAGSSEPFEHVMGFHGGPDSAVLVLTKSSKRPPGPNLNDRVILLAPDAHDLADLIQAQGVKTREVVPEIAYFLTDPEGNTVELYTPPKP